MKRLINRIGEKGVNNQGLNMEIIGYRNGKDMDVIFDDGYIKYHTKYPYFKNKEIKNPYKKDVRGFGCLGEGFGKKHLGYMSWNHMLERCYDKKGINPSYSTYKDCTVCEEWLNFQNFAKWYDENYYEIENERMELDKDILTKSNKFYSPETCVFVPHRINCLFTKSDKARGKLPIGVSLHSKNKTYISQCNIVENNIKTRKYLGSFRTPEEAFSVYKEFKEQYIKQVANEYKSKIPQKLYDALINYEVEATD